MVYSYTIFTRHICMSILYKTVTDALSIAYTAALYQCRKPYQTVLFGKQICLRGCWVQIHRDSDTTVSLVLFPTEIIQFGHNDLRYLKKLRRAYHSATNMRGGRWALVLSTLSCLVLTALAGTCSDFVQAVASASLKKYCFDDLTRNCDSCFAEFAGTTDGNVIKLLRLSSRCGTRFSNQLKKDGFTSENARDVLQFLSSCPITASSNPMTAQIIDRDQPGQIPIGNQFLLVFIAAFILFLPTIIGVTGLAGLLSL